MKQNSVLGINFLKVELLVEFVKHFCFGFWEKNRVIIVVLEENIQFGVLIWLLIE